MENESLRKHFVLGADCNKLFVFKVFDVLWDREKKDALRDEFDKMYTKMNEFDSMEYFKCKRHEKREIDCGGVNDEGIRRNRRKCHKRKLFYLKDNLVEKKNVSNKYMTPSMLTTSAKTNKTQMLFQWFNSKKFSSLVEIEPTCPVEQKVPRLECNLDTDMVYVNPNMFCEAKKGLLIDSDGIVFYIFVKEWIKVELPINAIKSFCIYDRPWLFKICVKPLVAPELLLLTADVNDPSSNALKLTARRGVAVKDVIVVFPKSPIQVDELEIVRKILGSERVQLIPQNTGECCELLKNIFSRLPKLVDFAYTSQILSWPNFVTYVQYLQQAINAPSLGRTPKNSQPAGPAQTTPVVQNVIAANNIGNMNNIVGILPQNYPSIGAVPIQAATGGAMPNLSYLSNIISPFVTVNGAPAVTADKLDSYSNIFHRIQNGPTAAVAVNGSTTVNQSTENVQQDATTKTNFSPVKAKKESESSNLFYCPGRNLSNVFDRYNYAPAPNHNVVIHGSDLMCLNFGQYLNDNIINFYLTYIQCEVMTEEQRRRTHIFNVFFYTKLQGTSPTSANDTPEIRHARVSKWTKMVDIFDKDYIIIPINESQHWFLAIVCFPWMAGMISYEQMYNSSSNSQQMPAEIPDNRSDFASRERINRFKYLQEELMMDPKPCILLFDSLQYQSRAPNLKIIREYLKSEWDNKRSIRDGSLVFDKNTIRGFNPQVPQQTNTIDCGVFVLHYVEMFFRHPLKDFTKEYFQSSLLHWFDKETVNEKRSFIQNLVLKKAETEPVKFEKRSGRKSKLFSDDSNADVDVSVEMV